MIEPYEGRRLLFVEYDQRPFGIKLVNLVRRHTDLLQRPTAPATGITPTAKRDELIEFVSSYSEINDYTRVAKNISTQSAMMPGVALGMFLSKNSEGLTLIRSRPKSDLYATRNVDIGAIHRELIDFLDSKRHGVAVRNAIFSGLISTFDKVLAETIRKCLYYKPDLLNQLDIPVSYKDIVAALDFPSMQRRVVEDVVESILVKSRLQQIQWIEDALDIKLQRVLKSWPQFIEACERRNCYIHNDAIVSQQYVDRIQSATGVKQKSEVGSRLYHSPEYFAAASDALLEMAVLITQLASRAMMSANDKSLAEDIEDSYNQALYDQLTNERYQSVTRLSSLFSEKVISLRDSCGKMAIINHAIAEKSSGRPKRVERILAATDWSSAKGEFEIAIAALNEDVPKVCELIPRLQHSDLLTPESYLSWPVFKFIRGNEQFVETLERVHGDKVGNIAVSGNIEAEGDLDKR